MEELRRSVVRLAAISKPVRWYHPWEFGYQQNSNGSGCIIDGDRILTAAHLVADALHIQVTKANDVRSYSARVLSVDHDSELALLAVDDSHFFAGTKSVCLGDLPAHHATVSVWGFPSNGKEVCITSGVVSRIEVTPYSHSGRYLLALQTDAAINPGSSGGPVFLNSQLVGIAFQSHEASEFHRSGYVIPVPVVSHFLADLEDGSVGGVPDLGIHWQKIENDNLREYAGLDSDRSGVLVSNVVLGSSADGVLERGDVVTSIDHVPIACDGSIPLSNDHRVNFAHTVNSRQVGEAVQIGIIRGGERVDREVRLKRLSTLVPLPQPSARATYFISAGLVFQPLSVNYITIWGWDKADCRFKSDYHYGHPSAQRSEVVLLSHVLAHDVNVGYHQVKGAVVVRVNNKQIRHMKDLVDAFRQPSGRFQVIELENAGIRAYDSCASRVAWIVIDVERALDASAEILLQHGIAADRSADLRGVEPSVA